MPATREDDVGFCSSGGLEGGIVEALGLLDEFFEVFEICGVFRGPRDIIVDVRVNELLEEALLLSGVGDDRVYHPGKKCRSCGKACGGHYDHVGEDEILW